MTLADTLKGGFRAHLLSQVTFTVSNAVLLIVLTRYLLSPAEYGLLNVALSLVGVVAIFGNLGLPKATAKYVTEYVTRDPSQVPRILSRSFGYLFVLLVVASGAFGALAGPIARLVGQPSLAPMLLLGVGYVAFNAIYQYAVSVFQGLNRVRVCSLLRIVLSLGRVAFAVVFILLGFGAIGAFLGYVAGFVLGGLLGVGLLYVRFYRSFDRATDIEAGLSRRLLRYSVPLTATRGANVLDKKVDIVLVGMLVGPVAASYYTLAKQIAGFTSMPAASIGFTISPTLGEQKAGDDLERAARLYETSLEYVLLLYVPATVGVVLVARPLVRLVFGAQYLPAVPVVQVFAGFIFVDAINQTTSDALDFLGRARARAIAKGVTAVGNLALNLVLIPRYGAAGAAVATVVTSTVFVAINLYSIHDELSLRVRRLALRTASICAISLGMAVVVAVLLPVVRGPVTLAGVVLVGGGIWATLASLSGLLDVREMVSLLT